MSSYGMRRRVWGLPVAWPPDVEEAGMDQGEAAVREALVRFSDGGATTESLRDAMAWLYGRAFREGRQHEPESRFVQCPGAVGGTARGGVMGFEEATSLKWTCDACGRVFLMLQHEGFPDGYHGTARETGSWGGSALVNWWACRKSHIGRAITSAIERASET